MDKGLDGQLGLKGHYNSDRISATMALNFNHQDWMANYGLHVLQELSLITQSITHSPSFHILYMGGLRIVSSLFRISVTHGRYEMICQSGLNPAQRYSDIILSD